MLKLSYFKRDNGKKDNLGLYVLFKIFYSYPYDKKVNMKGSVQ